MRNLLMLLLSAGLIFSACKKKGCTDPTATNYNSEASKDDGSCIFAPPAPTGPNYLCDGVSGNSDYIPFATGYRWTYDRSGDVFWEEVMGTTVILGLTYWEIDFWNGQLQLSGTHHYRVDPANGDIYFRGTGGSEQLHVPGNPVVSQVFDVDKTIVSLNSTVTTASCTYTGCLEIQRSGAIPKTFYYKPGIGFIQDVTAFGVGDELNAVVF